MGRTHRGALELTDTGTNSGIFLDNGNTTDPSVDGQITYVDGTGFRGMAETAVITLGAAGAGAVGTWDELYAADENLTISAGSLTFNGTADVDVITINGNADVDSGALLQFASTGDAKDIQGTGDTWNVSKAGYVTAVRAYVSGYVSTATTADLTLHTNNGTNSSSIVITDGVNGDITCAMNGTGMVVISGTTETNPALTVSNGDVVVSDGSLAITDDDTAASLTITNTANFIATTSGVVTIVADTATAGNIIDINADAMTSGTVIHLDVTGATFTGEYIDCTDGGTSEFKVLRYGATTIRGNAAGADALTLTAGDATITSGDVVISAGSLDITEDSTTNVALVVATSGTSVDAVTITADALTGTESALSISVDGLVDGVGVKVENTGETLTSGELLQILNTENGNLATKTGNVVSVTSDLEESAGTVTSNYDMVLFSRADTQAHASQYDAQGSVVKILKTLDKAAGTIVDAVIALEIESAVANTALPLGATVQITEVGVGATALNIIAAGVGASDVVITGSGAHTDNLAVLNVVTGGNLAAGGNILRVDGGATDPNGGAILVEFDFAGLANTNEPTGVKIDGGGKKLVALAVDADPVAGSVATFHSDAVIAANQGVVHITSTGAIADGAAALRVAVTGTPAAATCYGVEVDFTGITADNDPVALFINGTGKDVAGIMVDTDNTNIEAVAISGTGNITSAGNMLLVTNDGVPAASANVVQFSFTGTATNTPTILDLLGAGKDCQAISTDTDNTATHAVSIAGDGVLTSAGSMLYVQNDATCAADSFLVKFVFDGADTNNVGVLSINADTYGAAIDIDQDGTHATSDAIAININTDNSGAGDQVALNVTLTDESKSYFAKFANAVTAWTSTKSPETDAEAGWLKIDVNGTPYFLPFYAAS